VDVSPKLSGRGLETDHSPPSSAEVKNSVAIHPLSHTPPWHGAKFIKSRDNITFYYTKPLNILCEKYADIFNVKADDIYV
jgi:hypothetical protein